jgi:hypothetical protein
MWAQVFNTMLGIWLMAAPQVLGYNGIAADNDHILGPVVASFAIIALSGCTRSVARFNTPLGAWLLLAPWLLGYENQIAVVNDIATGLLIVIFSFFERKANHLYGGGWRQVWGGGETSVQKWP